MTIPKIIHQTYKDYNLPEIYKICQTQVKNLHPEYEYHFYTDNDINLFIKRNYPKYYDKFIKLPKNIMKIDMFRYFLMYKYGGIYIDMDYLMFKPFDIIEKKIVLPCNVQDKKGNPICVGNSIFASIPNHPFWKCVIDTLFTIDRTIINTDLEILSSNGTGPYFIFEMWKTYPKFKEDIYIPNKNLFHPPSKLTIESIANIKNSKSYGIHICTMSWRNNKSRLFSNDILNIIKIDYL